MPLTFNIHHVEKKDLHLEGDLAIGELELDLHDEMIRPAEAVDYDLEVQRLEGGALVRGTIRLPVEYMCVRCLKKFKRPLELPDWTVHVQLSGEDAVEVSNDLVNLTPYLREDILLALPQHPLCEPECRGLKVPAPAKDPVESASAWDELNKLKLKD
jgi:uncharacterized metal-binding protein YceD (DUF177 family)